MTRTVAVLARFTEHQPSARLRDMSDGYRVAAEALNVAADLGCSGDLYDALWAIVEREGNRAQGIGLGGK